MEETSMNSLNEPLLAEDNDNELGGYPPATAVDGDWGPVVHHKELDSPTEIITSPEEERTHWRRKVIITIVVFAIITLFFGLMAAVSADVQKNETECTECPVVGTTASNVSQMLLPLVYISALLASWYVEKPRRQLKQFVIDNLKQVISGAVTHFEATGAAVVLNQLVSHIQACDWYLVLFMMDTAYGCFLTVTVHALTVRLSAKYEWSEPLSRLGDYKKKPNPDGTRDKSTAQQQVWIWVAQTLHWTVTAVLMRGVVILFVWWFHESLGDSAVYLGQWACDEYQVRVKTFLNIVFFPVIFDAVQVSVQSFALKPAASFVEAEKVRQRLKKEAIAKAAVVG